MFQIKFLFHTLILIYKLDALMQNRMSLHDTNKNNNINSYFDVNNDSNNNNNCSLICSYCVIVVVWFMKLDICFLLCVIYVLLFLLFLNIFNVAIKFTKSKVLPYEIFKYFLKIHCYFYKKILISFNKS